MSQPNCDACTNLREYAPEFVMSGVTENVATSLKNNTGLNAALTVLHDNCEDLQDVNDCLIGRLGQELESYDVCDWKDLMSKMLPNLYETLKAMIMNECGQWTKMHDLCVLADALVTPPVNNFGVYPYLKPEIKRHLGRKNSNLTIAARPSKTVHAQNWGVGVMYGREEVTSCETGDTEVLEWIGPHGSNVAVSSLNPGDEIFSMSKSEFFDVMGGSEYLWNLFQTQWPMWMWGTNLKNSVIFLTMKGVGNRLFVQFDGTNAPVSGLSNDSYNGVGIQNIRLYRHRAEDTDTSREDNEEQIP